jgi:hypothetical protein
MINILYSIPYYKYTVSDWQLKKVKMQESMSHQVFSRNEVNDVSFFSSDRKNYRNYINNFLSIFDEELQEFGNELKLESFKIEDIWTVRYDKGDFHAVHNHGSCNLSGILYFDQDEQEHTSTNFVVGQDNIKNFTQIVSPPMKEGEIIIFPSNLLHFTTPNNSDKPRRVISFDITIDI